MLNGFLKAMLSFKQGLIGEVRADDHNSPSGVVIQDSVNADLRCNTALFIRDAKEQKKTIWFMELTAQIMVSTAGFPV